MKMKLKTTTCRGPLAFALAVTIVLAGTGSAQALELSQGEPACNRPNPAHDDAETFVVAIHLENEPLPVGRSVVEAGMNQGLSQRGDEIRADRRNAVSDDLWKHRTKSHWSTGSCAAQGGTDGNKR